jgi:dTDP-4-amino-4,6-dideoxygalactose transaminase
VSRGRGFRQTPLEFSPPLIGAEEIAEVEDALRSGWITRGPKTASFEEQFAEYVSAPAALAVNSGTAALHLGLVAAGVGVGDRVITSVMTFPGAMHVIELVGAAPSLVDVCEDTLNIDPALVEEKIRKSDVEAECRGGVVIPVHLYGHPCAMGELRAAVDDRWRLLEDAAHALPARTEGKLIGSGGSLAAFSFYATKNLTTGEGGMLTGPTEDIERARVLALHGISRDGWSRRGLSRSWDYDIVAFGFKYNMSDLQAAVGIQQLRRLTSGHGRRREIVSHYNEGFKDNEQLQRPVERPEVVSAWHIYALRLNLETLRIDRDRFANELEARNIGVSVHFKPIPMHSYFRTKYGYRPEDFPVASREYPRLLSLPLHPGLSQEDVDDVIEAVTDVAAQHRR